MFVACSDDKEPLPVGDEWIDPVFAEVLQERGYIADAKTVTPHEVANIMAIDVSGPYGIRGAIKSLRGISHFTNLRNLDCGNNQLEALDVSQNAALIELDCSDNRLTALDVSKSRALAKLRCNPEPSTTSARPIPLWL